MSSMALSSINILTLSSGKNIRRTRRVKRRHNTCLILGSLDPGYFRGRTRPPLTKLVFSPGGESAFAGPTPWEKH